MSIERTIFFLMANLGSDMSQLFSHIEKDETHLARLSAIRAQRIIEEIMMKRELRNGVKEIQILKNIINDALSEKPQFEIRKAEIENYFMPFALRALRQ